MPERRGAPGQGRWYAVVREIGLALVVSGVVVLMFVAYDLFGTNFAEQQSQARLAHEFSAALSRSAGSNQRASRLQSGRYLNVNQPKQAPSAGSSAGLVPHPRRAGNAGPARKSLPAPRSVPVRDVSISAPPGGALDHLVIPAIGVNRYVVEGVQEQDLQLGPGHYPGTPLPGQRGNVGIAGHRTTFGAPFFRLNELGTGDLIYLTDLSGATWVYSVRDKWVVLPSDVAVLDPTRGADLTLTTCNPRFWATTRLVVRAVLVEHLAPRAKFPGGLPARLEAPRPARSASAGVAPASVGQASGASRARGTNTIPTGVGVGSSTSLSGTAARTSPTGASSGTSEGQPEASPGSPVVGGAAVTLGGAGTWTWAGALGFGALAVGVWVATRLLAARRHRYAKVALLVAGALVSLVPLWFAFGAAVNLLPANF
jgi:LPXTG-site transpeptidase (sortase) family protein